MAGHTGCYVDSGRLGVRLMMFVDHVSFSYDSDFCQILISPHVQTASKQKVKMDEQDVQHKHTDHILLPVTAAMPHNGVDRPTMRWSFEMAAGAHSDQNLHEFIERTGRRDFGIFFILVSPEMLFFFSCVRHHLWVDNVICTQENVLL